MTIHHSLDYYLRMGCLPILERYRLKDIKSEYGCFIALDVCFPLYKVLEMKAQSLEGTWNEISYYVNNAFRIITDEYDEDLGIEEPVKLRDVDREIIHEIEYQLKTPPTACYPIYFITVGDGAEERLVYVGKTSSKNHRFSGGHSAALKLHAPKYEVLSKHIYFGTIVFLDHEKNSMPLEFIQPLKDSKNLLTNLEAGLIYNLKPELNSTYLNKSHIDFESPYEILEIDKILSSFIQELSTPVDPNKSEIEYIPTQYITELIKTKGFDGILFDSAMGPGNNVVIFDENNVDAKSIQIIEINNIKYSYYLK